MRYVKAKKRWQGWFWDHSAGPSRHGEPNGGAAQRLARQYWTGPEGWLLIERPLPGQGGDRKWYYSNLPAGTSIARLVSLAHARSIIEQFREDAKGESGLDQYQGRRWDGLHRHIALVMLAYPFLAQQRDPGSQNVEEGLSSLKGGLTLPVVHRRVLLLLWQNLIIWYIDTNQIESFRPRRS